MSEHPSNQLQDYELPNDQLQFEFDLMDSYSQKFPERGWLMDDALIKLKKFAGFAIPTYKVSDEDFVDMWTNGAADENGYLDTGVVKPLWSKLSIVGSLSPEEELELLQTEGGAAKLDVRKYCDINFGEVPEYSTELLKGLYQLTGAQVALVTEPITGGASGKVFRQGTYHDTPIYFIEATTKESPNWFGEDIFDVSVNSQECGERLLALFSGPPVTK